MTANTSTAKVSDNARDKLSSLSIFMPCYNEEANIRRTAEQAVSVLGHLDIDWELILINDGSADSTGEIADQIAAENKRVRVVHHEQNLGYGSALQSGFGAASKDLVFYTDGDGQFDISEMPDLLGLMADFDIVSCYRLDRQDNFIRRFNAWCWTKLVCLLFRMRIRDIDCAFKLYRREIFDDMNLVSTGALIDAEVLARATAKGYRITQRPVHHYPRTAGEQTGANIRVILRAFKELFRLYGRIKNEES